MNFNQPPNGRGNGNSPAYNPQNHPPSQQSQISSSQIPPQMNPHPQSSAQSHQQQNSQQPPRGFPMQLPPQLANLTPAQLQQLKQQPNFQNILRAYMQKQYLQQQQQKQQVPNNPSHLQQPQNTTADSSQNASRVAGMSSGISAGQQLPGTGARPNLTPAQQQALMAQANSRSLNGAQGLTNTNMGVASGPGQVSGQIPGQIPQQIPQRMPSQPMARPGAGPTGPQNQFLTNGNFNGRIAPESPHQVDQSFTDFPPVAPEILSKIKFDRLSSYDQWSKKLKSEGKEVPGSVKVYESMINREAKSKAKAAKQAEANRNSAAKLIQDAKAYNELKQLRMNAITLSQKNQFNNSLWGEGYQGYGNGTTNTMTQLILPANRKRNSTVPETMATERDTNRRVIEQLLDNPNRNLVPIRLEFEQERDRFKLRDTFLWDLNEQEITIEQFVGMLLEDYKFISSSHMSTIVASINEQIKDYQKQPEKTMGELRVPIKINITLNNTQYTDQFEWDILNFEDNDPEEFSNMLCEEMNLPGEFATAIAHNIREQTQLFHKSLFLVGYSFDGSAVNEDEIRSHLLPPLRLMTQGSKDQVDEYLSILRNPANVIDYSPTLIKLTQLELERLEKEIERESRRKRRHNTYEEQATTGRGSSRRAAFHGGRGGPVLPDLSDIPKTFRTPQPSSVLPGGVDLGVPEINAYDEVIVHRSQVANPDYKPPQPKIRRVSYQHNSSLGAFMVKIKLGSTPRSGAYPYDRYNLS